VCLERKYNLLVIGLYLLFGKNNDGVIPIIGQQVKQSNDSGNKTN
jgi:hypothetical protein